MRKKKGILAKKTMYGGSLGKRLNLGAWFWDITQFPRQVDSYMYGTKNTNFEVVYINGIESLGNE